MIPNNLLIFDTHCHLADQKYQGQDITKIIQQAREKNVKSILNVGYNQLANSKVIEQIKKHSSLFGALGLHPNDGNQDFQEENLTWIEKQLSNQKIIAIGEIGLDYYRDFTPPETQKY